MIRSSVITLLFSILLSACGSPGAEGDGSAAPAANDRPPNIVVIMADDLGWGDLEPYGQEKIHTPSLARMANEGTRFTAFYAGSTVCAPLAAC